MGRRLVVLAGAGVLLVAAPRPARAPSAVTGPTTSVGATTAVVTGKVDPAGGDELVRRVRGDRRLRLAHRRAKRRERHRQVDVSEQLRGLQTGVTYHYRLVATNASGTARAPT